MMRIEGWESRLPILLGAARDKPFAWGSFDCALFACDVLGGITGVDPAEGLRGRYRTAQGAYRALIRYLGSPHPRPLEEVAERICAKHGWPRYPRVAMARRGDPVFHDDTTLLDEPFPERCVLGSLGICEGFTVLFAAERGFVRVPLKKCKTAWAAGWPEGAVPHD